MKKITLGTIVLLLMLSLTGCGNTKTKQEVIEEIQQTLDSNNVQVLTAFEDNFDAKAALIQSDDLTADGLIALCINPKPMNIANSGVQELFEEAVERTELTAEQQVQIAKISKFAYHRALLLSSNLTAEGLVAICENSGSMNLENTNIKNWFKDAFERIELTPEQQVQIAKISKNTYHEALLLSSNLTGEGLVAICENPSNINLDSTYLQELFKEAVEKTELTPEQQVQIAKIDEFTYNRALLLSNNLTAEGLVAICENSNSLNLENTNIKNWFKDAIKRTELTIEQQSKISTSLIGGMGLF